MNKNKGITLIALVVTIIVLIILAGISINLLLGDNGILKKAKDSASEQEIGQRKEAVSMAVTAEFANKNGDTSQMTVEGVLKELQNTQGSTSIYAKKDDTEIRSTDGSTPLEGGVTFHFPSGTDEEVVVTIDENFGVTVANTQTVDNNNNNNNQSQGGQEGEEEQTTDDEYGFFDEEGNQLISWTKLTQAPYYLNIERDYSDSGGSNMVTVNHGEEGNSYWYVVANISTLSNGAFSETDIKQFKIPGNVSSGNNNKFTENIKLASISSDGILDSKKVATNTITPVTRIGNYAIYLIGRHLKNIEIPNTVRSLGAMSLCGCSSLTNITIPNSVENIGNGAFSLCDGLTSAYIPSSVTSIGENVFGKCKNLTTVVVDSNNNVYDSRNNCNAIIETSTNKLIYGCKTTIIPSTVKTIGRFAFSDCENLENMVIPNGVESIEERAFTNCNLKSLRIPDSVSSIEDYAFWDCDKLENITIGSGLTTIKSYVFYYCRSLTSLTIPDTVKIIENGAFKNCTELTSVTIGSRCNEYRQRCLWRM